MKFKFRLARVLNVLSLRETMKKMEVASLTREIVEIRGKRTALELDVLRLLEEGPKRFSEGMQWANYQVSRIAANRSDIQRLTKTLAGLEETLAERRAELTRLSMKRKALENLRDKRKAEFTLSRNRREQKQMDELHMLFPKEES